MLILQRAARPHHGGRPTPRTTPCPVKRPLPDNLTHDGLKRPSVTINGYSLELPFMRGVKQWAVLTIGTGLGNASYVNTGVRPKPRRR